MSHYDKIPDLLANLVASPSIAEACRRTGMTPATHWNYLIRSKQGDPLFQEIEWHEVKAPYWQHVANTRVLAAAAIEQAALDRALNGCWVPSYFKGEPVFETNEEFLGWTDDEMRALGYDPVRDRFIWEGDPPRRKQVMVWLKPSEQLAIKMLKSWHKRYRPHQQVDVNVGGVLRLDRPNERTGSKTIEAKPLLDDGDDVVEQRGGLLALGRPAKDSAEMDKWNAAGEFNPQPVAFVDAEGNRTVRVAALDPLLAQPKDSDLVRAPNPKVVLPPAHPTPATAAGGETGTRRGQQRGLRP